MDDPIARALVEAQKLIQQDGLGALDGVTALSTELPESPQLNYLVGFLHYQRSELAPAIRRFEIALAQEPLFDRCRVLLGQAYIASGQDSQVEQLLEDSRASDSVRQLILRCLVTRSLETGNDMEAKAFARRCLAVAPHDEVSRLVLAEAVLKEEPPLPRPLRSPSGPAVTVGVIRFDGKIHMTLRSLAEQTYRNFTVIIADAGSVSLDEHRAFAPLDRSPIPVEVLYRPNCGAPDLLRILADRARTELLLVCDDGCYLEPFCLERLVETAAVSADIGIVGAVERSVESHSLPSHPRSLEEVTTAEDVWFTTDWEKHVRPFDDSSARPTEHPFIYHHCSLLRRSAVETVGVPEGYSCFGFRADVELSCRLTANSYRLLLHPGATFYSIRSPLAMTPECEELLAQDGLRLIARLSGFRQKRRDIRVLIVHDPRDAAPDEFVVPLAHHLPPDIDADIVSIGDPFDHTDYDVIFATSADTLEAFHEELPPEKLIVGYRVTAARDSYSPVLPAVRCAAGIVADRVMLRQVQAAGGIFYCPPGVDIHHFSPSQHINSESTASWIENGDADEYDLLRQACEEAGWKLLTGKREAYSPSSTWLRDEVFRRSNVFVTTAATERVLQALATGLGVISTSVGYAPEVVVDGYNGALVDCSMCSIRDGLKAIASLPPEHLRENARHSVTIGWTWEEQARRYGAVFRRIASRDGEIPDEHVPPEAVKRAIERIPVGFFL